MSTPTGTPSDTPTDTPTDTAVITIVHGRRDHLRAQRVSLAAGGLPLAQHVVIAMDDPDLAATSFCSGSLSGTPLGLPLAAARNLGAATAIERGASTLVFLDVDCLAGRDLVSGYTDVVAAEPGTIWSGPVTYLDPPPVGGYDLASLPDLDAPHPGRPAPAPGQRVPGADPDLFWSLSFACSSEAWRRTGGFCERYVGYGGEDTDFARIVVDTGLDLGWVGAARAYHQWHPVSRPPVEHVVDIARNAEIFRQRWGVTPMTGWLREFERLGVAHQDAQGRWRPTPDHRGQG